MQDKLKLVQGERDGKDALVKKLKKNNEILSAKIKDIETQNSHLSEQLE